MDDRSPQRTPSRWTSFELDCLMELESSDESSAEQAHSSSDNPLWDNFETAAHSVALLYRNPSWKAFQQSAAQTTQLYKDSVEAQRRGVEQGMLLGRQRLVKELLGLLKSKPSKSAWVRREELLAFLAGKSPPPPPLHPVRHASLTSPVLRTMDQLRLQSPIQAKREDSADAPTALHMFHEALTLTHGSSPVRSSSSGRRPQELGSFLVEELKRHRKRRREGEGSPSRDLYWNKRQRRL